MIFFNVKLYTGRTKTRPVKIHDNISLICDGCQQAPKNLIHSLWHCPALFKYPTDITDTLSEVVRVRINTNILSAPSSSVLLFVLHYLTLTKKDGIALTDFDELEMSGTFLMFHTLEHWKRFSCHAMDLTCRDLFPTIFRVSSFQFTHGALIDRLVEVFQRKYSF